MLKKMSNIKEYIKSLPLEEGQSTRRDCPNCKGVNTLSVSCIEGSLVYQCFSLRCDVRDSIYQGMSVATIKKRLNTNSFNLWGSAILPMDIPEYVIQPTKQHKLLTDFINRWKLHDTELLYDVKDKRAFFPIKEKGKIIDATGRALDGAIPKWLRYTSVIPNSFRPVYQVCNGPPNGCVVIVEDAISANTICSVCPNVTGMAILGTSLSVKHTEHLQDFVRIIIALDPDAANKTLQYKREVASWTGVNTIAMRLHNDIKYRVEEDIIKLKGLTT